MNAATLTLLLLTATPGGAGPQVCADVYDSTEQCSAVEQTPLLGASEDAPRPSSSARDTMGVEDSGAIGWRFMMAAAMTAAGGGALQVGAFFYELHAQRRAEAGNLTPDELIPIGNTILLTRVTTAGLWFLSALLAGSGVAFWVFDPATGKLRYAWLEDDGG